MTWSHPVADVEPDAGVDEATLVANADSEGVVIDGCPDGVLDATGAPVVPVPTLREHATRQTAATTSEIKRSGASDRAR
jgi:hypothetical protein